MITMPLSAAGAWFRELGKQFPDPARKGLHSAALKIVQTLQADQSIPRDRGTSRAAWRAEPTDVGADVFNLTPTMMLIERGVRPENVKIGRKMITALMEWARRHGMGHHHEYSATITRLSKKMGGSGRATIPRKLVRAKASDKQVEGIAWAIAKSIQKRGIFNDPQRGGKSGGGIQPLRTIMRTRAPAIVAEEVRAELMKFVRSGGKL